MCRCRRCRQNTHSARTEHFTVTTKKAKNVDSNCQSDLPINPISILNSDPNDAILKLSIDMHSLFSKLSTRIDRLEDNVEKRIIKHLDSRIDKKIEATVTTIRKELKEEIPGYPV